MTEILEYTPTKLHTSKKKQKNSRLFQHVLTVVLYISVSALKTLYPVFFPYHSLPSIFTSPPAWLLQPPPACLVELAECTQKSTPAQIYRAHLQEIIQRFPTILFF
jgi:hypothetical protein